MGDSILTLSGQMSTSPKPVLETPAPPRPPATISEIKNLAALVVTNEVLSDLRDLTARARRFASDGRAWAERLRSSWPVLMIERSPMGRSFEKSWPSSSWILSGIKNADCYRCCGSSKSCGKLSKNIRHLRGPLGCKLHRSDDGRHFCADGCPSGDQVRASGEVRGRDVWAIGPSTKEEAKTDLKALLSYRTLANEIFEVECDTAIEETGGERFLIVKIPVPQSLPQPHRALADKEERLHLAMEALSPEFVGRIILEYVPQSGAA